MVSTIRLIHQQQVLLAYKFILQKSFKVIVHRRTRDAHTLLVSVREQFNTYTANRQTIISERCEPKFRKLEHIKTVATDLYPIIAGAIGENMVAKELEKLSDDFVLFHDFSLTFDKPIYNKKKNDRIHSIQIDHLLVTHAGVFIIETKNWSKKSLERYDLRSPVAQIQRAGFAIYVLLNSNKRRSILKPHHWGSKEIPLRNIIAMIHHKPREKFQYVTIKKLKELNGYINHFKPLFDNSEIQSIADYLMDMKN